MSEDDADLWHTDWRSMPHPDIHISLNKHVFPLHCFALARCRYFKSAFAWPAFDKTKPFVLTPPEFPFDLDDDNLRTSFEDVLDFLYFGKWKNYPIERWVAFFVWVQFLGVPTTSILRDTRKVLKDYAFTLADLVLLYKVLKTLPLSDELDALHQDIFKTICTMKYHRYKDVASFLTMDKGEVLAHLTPPTTFATPFMYWSSVVQLIQAYNDAGMRDDATALIDHLKSLDEEQKIHLVTVGDVSRGSLATLYGAWEKLPEDVRPFSQQDFLEALRLLFFRRHDYRDEHCGFGTCISPPLYLTETFDLSSPTSIRVKHPHHFYRYTFALAYTVKKDGRRSVGIIVRPCHKDCPCGMCDLDYYICQYKYRCAFWLTYNNDTNETVSRSFEYCQENDRYFGRSKGPPAILDDMGWTGGNLLVQARVQIVSETIKASVSTPPYSPFPYHSDSDAFDES